MKILMLLEIPDNPKRNAVEDQKFRALIHDEIRGSLEYYPIDIIRLDVAEVDGVTEQSIWSDVMHRATPPVERKPEACMACWSSYVDCDGACGARICGCNLSTHDCDEFVEDLPHEADCPHPAVACACIKSLNDDQRRARRDAKHI